MASCRNQRTILPACGAGIGRWAHRRFASPSLHPVRHIWLFFLLSLILPFMVQYRNTLLRRSKMNGTKWAPARVTPFTIGTLMFLHNRLFDHRAMTFLRLHIFQISAYTNRAFGNCFNFNEIRSDLSLFYRISWSSFVGGLVKYESNWNCAPDRRLCYNKAKNNRRVNSAYYCLFSPFSQCFIQSFLGTPS